jgi:hypothetical protein
MRVVTWNLAYMTPGTYKATTIREQQWQFLLGLDADLMLLQECRPDDLATVAGSDAGYDVVGSLQPRAHRRLLPRQGVSPAVVQQGASGSAVECDPRLQRLPGSARRSSASKTTLPDDAARCCAL